MTLSRVVVPLDGSAQAEHALLPAADLARRAHAILALVHADTPENYIYVEGLPVLGGQGRIVRATDGGSHEQIYLQRIAARLQESHHIGVTPVVLSEPGATAAHMLSRYLGDNPATTLVVMTTHGRGGLERLWMGSVAEQLLRLAHVPMLLLKPAPVPTPELAPWQIRRVLVPLDGSAVAEQMLPIALNLAELYDARLALMRVVHIYDQAVVMPFSAPHFTHDDTWQQRQAQAEAYLQALANQTSSRTTSVATHVVISSHVAQSIVEAAQNVPGTLIAMTTHARMGWDRMLIGSVADKVLRAANEPVLMQRPV